MKSIQDLQDELHKHGMESRDRHAKITETTLNSDNSLRLPVVIGEVFGVSTVFADIVNFLEDNQMLTADEAKAFGGIIKDVSLKLQETVLRNCIELAQKQAMH